MRSVVVGEDGLQDAACHDEFADYRANELQSGDGRFG